MKADWLALHSPSKLMAHNKREREGKEGESDDPLIAAVLQNNIVRFQQLWDQAVAAGDKERLLTAKSTAISTSNVPLLRIMASTTNMSAVLGWTRLLSVYDIELAIRDNDLELVQFVYTVVTPPWPGPDTPQPHRWPLFYTSRHGLQVESDYFLQRAHTDEMCQLGVQLFGYLLLTPGSFNWLADVNYHPKKPGQVAALLKSSVEWWRTQRALVGPGAAILPPPAVGSVATPAYVSKVLREHVVVFPIGRDARQHFELYKQLTSSELWQVGEFMTPRAATLDLKDVLEETKGAEQATAAIAPLVTEWAQYIITELGGDWTWLFPDEEHAEQVLGEKRQWLLAVLFDALTVGYLVDLLVRSWDSVTAQRFLNLARWMADRLYLPERATVLALEAAFPGNVATSGVHIFSGVQKAVPMLSRIYRRVALLLRDVADIAPEQQQFLDMPYLPLDRRQHLRQLSTRLLARVAAAEPEHLAAVREVLESNTVNFPRTLADFTAFLPYHHRQNATTRRRMSYTTSLLRGGRW